MLDEGSGIVRRTTAERAAIVAENWPIVGPMHGVSSRKFTTATDHPSPVKGSSALARSSATSLNIWAA